MEKWKIGVIALLIAGLGAFGLMQEQQAKPGPTPPPQTTSTPNPFIGKIALSPALPEWSNIKQWANLGAIRGQAPTLKSLNGSVALVEVFRIECSHCQEAAPFMEALYERYKSRGLKLVGIHSPGDFKDPQNPENSWANVQSWLKEKGVKYPVGMDDKSAWFQGKVKGTLYPTMLIFDKTGKVAFAHTGHDMEKGMALAVALEKLLPSSEPLQKRAQNLAKWLSGFMSATPDKNLEKALTDDLVVRLKE